MGRTPHFKRRETPEILGEALFLRQELWPIMGGVRRRDCFGEGIPPLARDRNIPRKAKGKRRIGRTGCERIP